MKHERDEPMLEPVNASKISTLCPSGHKLRGNSGLIGRTVKCPRCSCEFVFELTLNRTSKTGGKQVSDTGVMRILGDMSALPPSPTRIDSSERPCSRCNALIPEDAPVCSHCKCYVGALPSFLKQMNSTSPQKNKI
jgi:hypothetical protein